MAVSRADFIGQTGIVRGISSRINVRCFGWSLSADYSNYQRRSPWRLNVIAFPAQYPDRRRDDQRW